MSSDNPFDQVEALIASDERQSLPEPVDAILRSIEKLDAFLPGVAKIVRTLRYESEKQRIENSVLMLNTAWEELKRVSAELDYLRQDTVKHGEVSRLILDASRKAEDLRDRKRVERIGKILAHAITLPLSDFDKAEEMMRVARDLSDRDILGLRYLYDTQFGVLQTRQSHVDVDDVNAIWSKNLASKIEGVHPNEYSSIFLKLQGLGLSGAVERNQAQIPPGEQVFALLSKGADFVHYIQGAVATDSAVSKL